MKRLNRRKYGRYLSDMSLKGIWIIGLSVLASWCFFLDNFWFI